MASQDAPLQELPGLQPDCLGHKEDSLPSFVTLHDLGTHVSLDRWVCMRLLSSAMSLFLEIFWHPLPTLYDTDTHRTDKLPAELAS